MKLVNALKTRWKQSIRLQNTNSNFLIFMITINSKNSYNILILGNYDE